jgi:hypothetical protein
MLLIPRIINLICQRFVPVEAPKLASKFTRRATATKRLKIDKAELTGSRGNTGGRVPSTTEGDRRKADPKMITTTRGNARVPTTIHFHLSRKSR